MGINPTCQLCGFKEEVESMKSLRLFLSTVYHPGSGLGRSGEQSKSMAFFLVSVSGDSQVVG